MEINVRQRMIGGVVLVALAVTFAPLLFKSTPSGTKRQLTLETSIPAAPARPSRQATITMQGEELNPQRNVVSTENVPAPTPDQQMLSPNQSAQPQPRARAAASSQPTTAAVESAALISPTRTATANVASPKPKPSSARVVAAQDTSLLEPTDETPVQAPAKTKAKPQTQTVHPAQVASATTGHNKKTKVVAAATPAKSTHEKLQPAKAWVVQLGSFGDVSKAKTLETQLRAKGFTAYSRTIKTSIGNMTRVFVGPEIKREKANALLAKVDSQLHIKGVVVAFQPAKAKTA